MCVTRFLSFFRRYGGLNGFSGGGRDGDRHRHGHNNQNSYRGQGFQNHGKNNYHNNHQFSSSKYRNRGGSEGVLSNGNGVWLVSCFWSLGALI